MLHFLTIILFLLSTSSVFAGVELTPPRCNIYITDKRKDGVIENQQMSLYVSEKHECISAASERKDDFDKYAYKERFVRWTWYETIKIPPKVIVKKPVMVAKK